MENKIKKCKKIANSGKENHDFIYMNKFINLNRIQNPLRERLLTKKSPIKPLTINKTSVI